MAALLEDGGKRLWMMLRIAGWGGAAVLLAAPLIAMQFTTEVDWTAGDFVFAGLLLGAAGGAMELALRISRGMAYRFAAVAAVGGTLLLIWSNLAVGIIGGENNPANQMYAVVLAIVVLGPILVRARPAGMAAVMAAAAVAQAGIGVIALAGNLGVDGANWPHDVINITGLFTLVWLASALLFREAARRPPAAA